MSRTETFHHHVLKMKSAVVINGAAEQVHDLPRGFVAQRLYLVIIGSQGRNLDSHVAAVLDICRNGRGFAVDYAGDFFGNFRFAHAEGLYVLDIGLYTEKVLGEKAFDFVKHGNKLSGRAGKQNKALTSRFDGAAVGGSAFVFENNGRFREHGLFHVALRAWHALCGKIVFNAPLRVGVYFERKSHGSENSLLGQIVLRRTETARKNNDVASRNGGAQRLHNVSGVIVHRRLASHLHPERGQLSRKKGGICICNVAGRDFRTDRDNFTIHKITFIL